MAIAKNAINKNGNSRIHFFDYARAFAIIFVVFIHIGFDCMNEIVLFAMPLFFVSSGYFYNGRQPYLKKIAGSFKKLMLPFYLGIIVYLFVELYRSGAFHYLSPSQMFKPILYNGLYGSGIIPGFTEGLRALADELCHKAQAKPSVDVMMPTTCHLWFQPAMFCAEAIFAALASRVKKPLAELSVIIVLLGIASLEVVFPVIKQLPLGLGRGAVGAAWMFAGHRLRETHLFETKNSTRNIEVFAASIIIMVLSLCLGSNGSALVTSYYGPYGALSVLITYIGGVASVIFICYVFRLFECLPFTKLKSVMEIIGKNTMMIYLWHMLPKTALELIYAKIIGRVPQLDEFYMGLIPEEAGLYMVLEGIIIFGLFYGIALHKKNAAN